MRAQHKKTFDKYAVMWHNIFNFKVAFDRGAEIISNIPIKKAFRYVKGIAAEGEPGLP